MVIFPYCFYLACYLNIRELLMSSRVSEPINMSWSIPVPILCVRPTLVLDLFLHSLLVSLLFQRPKPLSLCSWQSITHPFHLQSFEQCHYFQCSFSSLHGCDAFCKLYNIKLTKISLVRTITIFMLIALFIHFFFFLSIWHLFIDYLCIRWIIHTIYIW